MVYPSGAFAVLTGRREAYTKSVFWWIGFDDGGAAGESCMDVDGRKLIPFDSGQVLSGDGFWIPFWFFHELLGKNGPVIACFGFGVVLVEHEPGAVL